MHYGYVQHDDSIDRHAQADSSAAHEVNSASTISLDVASIDEAVQLTIANIPNALKLLENS